MHPDSSRNKRLLLYTCHIIFRSVVLPFVCTLPVWKLALRMQAFSGERLFSKPIGMPSLLERSVIGEIYKFGEGFEQQWNRMNQCEEKYDNILFSSPYWKHSSPMLLVAFYIEGGVNLKVRGLTGTKGGWRHRNAKIWGKKGRFCKNLAKIGGLQPPSPPGSAAHVLASPKTIKLTIYVSWGRNLFRAE